MHRVLSTVVRVWLLSWTLHDIVVNWTADCEDLYLLWKNDVTWGRRTWINQNSPEEELFTVLVCTCMRHNAAASLSYDHRVIEGMHAHPYVDIDTRIRRNRMSIVSNQIPYNTTNNELWQHWWQRTRVTTTHLASWFSENRGGLFYNSDETVDEFHYWNNEFCWWIRHTLMQA